MAPTPLPDRGSVAPEAPVSPPPTGQDSTTGANQPSSPNEAQTEVSRLSFMLRALRYRNYRLFFSGQIVSLLGTWITQVATTWLVYRLTGSALLLGVVGFAGQIPAFLLGPIAGVMIDRWPLHRLLVITQVLAMLQSFALAALALSGNIAIWHILVLMAFQGLVNAFDMPARQSFVIEMIENKEDLSNAIALNSSMFNIARLLGPSIGGLMIAALTARGGHGKAYAEGWCFLIDGFSYMAVIGCLLAMRVPPHTAAPRDVRPLQQLQEGYRYAFGFAPIRAILTLMAVMSLLGMSYTVLMPVIASKVLQGGPNTLGFLMAASGMGALAAAIALAARQSIRGLGKIIPLCTVTFAVALFGFCRSHVLWLALPLLFVMGFSMMMQNAACNTILQTIVEPDKRGRVMSLYTMAFMGMAPLGSLWAGALADRIGVTNTLTISAVGCLLLGFWFARRLPLLRDDVIPIYKRLGIIPEVALGVENASELSRPPQRHG